MRAVQVTRLDGPQAVQVADVPAPNGDDMVVIDVYAAGVSFPDVLLTRGLYQYKPPPPFILGTEVAGVVRSAPSGAHIRAGDRVAALTMQTGGMADVVAAQLETVFALPDSVSFHEGAGLLFNDFTVHFALRQRGRLAPGDTVMVHGAAGGIGTSALRLARAFGAARTIAVVSTADKIEAAKSAGATDVVLADGFKESVRELTDGRGVDIVLDPVGGDRFTDTLRSVAPGARVLVVGFAAGEIPTVRVNRLLLNNIDVVGVGWGPWIFGNPGYLAQQWAEIGPYLAAGKISAPQPTTYPLEKAAEALASLENRTANNKVVLTLRPQAHA